jgi:uncharacterized membrane protein YeaQ/YmgE (transglycosylase-associated protein family)
VNSKTLFALSVLCLVSGCQPKGPATHDCACLCYKDTGTTVYQTNVTVTTTQECGNVNGGACSWDGGGQHIDGQYANCGPNPNVSGPPWQAPVAWIVLGLIAGFIGSKLVNKTGEGFFLDIALGIVGAVIGGWLFSLVGMHGVTGLNLYSLIVAIIGAVVFLLVYHAIRRRTA